MLNNHLHCQFLLAKTVNHPVVKNLFIFDISELLQIPVFDGYIFCV